MASDPTVLLARHLRADPADPLWPDRDRLFHTQDAPPPPIDAIRLEGPPGFTTAIAAGAALAERMLAARFGRSLVDHRTWLLAGPAELAAGAAQEAASIAGAVPLGRLAIVASLPTEDSALAGRFAALGWRVRKVVASDPIGFDNAVSAAQRAQKPSLIMCIGAPGAVPDESAEARPRSASARRAWLKRQRRHGNAEAFERAQAGKAGPGWTDALVAPPSRTSLSPADAVTAALLRLAPAWIELSGLCAEPAQQGAFAGRTVAWGACTQAQAGGLLGMALHGGIVPVGLFARLCVDAALPAQRAAAELDVRTLHLVHEDAPLPASVLAAWRALPGARLFRPADAIEALDCLELALRHSRAPSILLLSGHAMQPGTTRPRACLRGGYLVQPAAGRDVTLIAAGSDLEIALAVRDLLAARFITAALVSLPCWHLFATQTEEYRRDILGAAPRVALEAGEPFGWDVLLGDRGLFVDTRASRDAAMIAQFVTRLLRRSAAVLDARPSLLASADDLD